jgi:hypothetical protein
MAIGAKLTLDGDAAPCWRWGRVSCLVTMCWLVAQGLVP